MSRVCSKMEPLLGDRGIRTSSLFICFGLYLRFELSHGREVLCTDSFMSILQVRQLNREFEKTTSTEIMASFFTATVEVPRHESL